MTSRATAVADTPAHTTVRIPADRYTSRDFAALEVEKLWSRVWQVACREEDLTAVGDYMEYVIADQSFLVVRAGPTEIKAYPNSCLHRGTKLKVGCGHTDELRCSFHAWCWDLNGTNRSVHDVHEFPGLDRADLQLPECKVGTWAGFVFINPDPECEPLEEFLGPLQALLAGFHIDKMRYQSIRRTRVPCNWKAGLEAFIESYHLLGTHPQGIMASDDVGTKYEVLERHGRFLVPIGVPSQRLGDVEESDMLDQMVPNVLSLQKYLRPQVERLKRLRDGLEGLPRGVRFRDLIIEMNKDRAEVLGWDVGGLDPSAYGINATYHIFPNVQCNVLVGELFMFLFRPDPSDPDWCTWDVLSLRFPEEGWEPPDPVEVPTVWEWDELVDRWGLVVAQDITNLLKVQQGMHNHTFTRSRLAATQESVVANFHRVLEQQLGIAPG